MSEILILTKVEPILEVANLAIALMIVFYGLYISKILKLDLRKIWLSLLSAILLFGIHELAGSLEEFGIFAIEGLYAFTEFLFILSFLYAVYRFHRFFINIKQKSK